MVQSNFHHLRKLQGPHVSMNTPGEIKNPRMQIRFRNTSWIRKYHKYDEMDRKIKNCDIFSTECKKTRWKCIKYYVRDNKVRGTSSIAKKVFLVVKNTTRS